VRRRDFLGALGVGIAGAAAARWLAGSARPRAGEVFVERWSWVMGQGPPAAFAGSETEGYEAAQAALSEMRRVEAVLSRFDGASDLAELNRRAGRGALAVHADLVAVLEAALRFERSTGGAFNPAVEPLMRHGVHAPRAEPTRAELAEARAARARRASRCAAAASRSAAMQLTWGIGVGRSHRARGCGCRHPAALST
jgi:thiamine biosynthesis lipoprotein